MSDTAAAIRAPALNPPSETDAVIMMIERAARDPGVDLDKLERLIALRNTMAEKAASIEFDTAMTAAQGEMRTVVKDMNNPSTRSKYASYAAMDRMLRPIYSKHGLALSFNTQEAGETSIRILCRVAKGGYGRDFQILMPADGKGAKGGEVMTRTHATGSAVTYGMRYLLKMIFNVAIGDAGDDDDGNDAGGSKGGYITAEQQALIRRILTDKGREADIGRFCQIYDAATLANIPAHRYSDALAYAQNAASKVAQQQQADLQNQKDGDR